MSTANENPFGENWRNLEFNGKAPSQPQLPTSVTIMANGQKKYEPMIYNTMNDKVFNIPMGIDRYDEQYITQAKKAVADLGAPALTEKFESELRKIERTLDSTENIIGRAVAALNLSADQTTQVNNAQSNFTASQINDALAKLSFLDGKDALKSELGKLNRVQVKELFTALQDSMKLPLCLQNPDLNYQTYEANYARSGIKVNTFFSQAKVGGPDLGIITYVPGAFVALHEHPSYEMVFVMHGDYIENGVTYTAGDMVLRGPNSYHSTASRTGCAILASRYEPVIQRPDLYNEFHQQRDNGEIDGNGNRVGNPLETTPTTKTIKFK